MSGDHPHPGDIMWGMALLWFGLPILVAAITAIRRRRWPK